MNNIIAIRGDQLAVSIHPGEWGDFANLTYIAPDWEELMTPGGLFLPACDSGLEALPVLKYGHGPASGPNLPEGVRKFFPGVKGVLISPEGESVQWYHVRMDANGFIRLNPLPTGTDGFSCVSAFELLNQSMATCYKLTKTIEEMVAMYCRHMASSVSDVRYYSRKELLDMILAYQKRNPPVKGKPNE